MEFKNRVAILGERGFVGQHLLNDLRQKKFNISGYARPQFDLCSPGTFAGFENTPVTIIDAITVIDDKERINQTNVKGLGTFIDYLNFRKTDFNYVYLSTISTNDRELIASNDYVRSKFNAERLIREKTDDYKIIRLSYPFGENEGENRLLTRLVRRVLRNEKIAVNNITLHLTPIGLLVSQFTNLVYRDQKEIDYKPSEGIALQNIMDAIVDIVNQLKATGYSGKEFKERNSDPFHQDYFSAQQIMQCLEDHIIRVARKFM